MIDVASGEALMDKTLAAARHLISNMAGNTQQFGVRGGGSTSRVVSEVSTFDSQRLENQLTELTSLVRRLIVGQHQQAMQRVCGICALVEHPTDMCLALQDTKCIGELEGELQYGRQSYPNLQFDNQQFRRQPYQLNPNQA
ncbi:hypothetical protein CR513_01411, partial [Mucuna pruriens]